MVTYVKFLKNKKQKEIKNKIKRNKERKSEILVLSAGWSAAALSA